MTDEKIETCPRCGMKGKRITEWLYKCYQCYQNYNPKIYHYEQPTEEDQIYTDLANTLEAKRDA